jgi:two-component system, OmpR family, sensor kinase
MKLWRLAALAPAIGGVIVALALANLLEPVPVAFMRVDVATLVLLFGISLAVPAAAALLFYEWWHKQIDQLQNQIQEQSSGERRRFLRRLDHELKNPLTAIRAGLANLTDSTTEAVRQDALCSIDTQALRLSRLAADLRKLAELETRPIDRTPVDLNQLLEEVFNLAQDQPDSGARQLTLTVPRAPWPLPVISGDPDLLLLALHNLLDNALKFTGPGDTVEVRAFEDGASVVIEVADTGPGISDEDMDHVWEELYRGRSAHGITGSGIGLALVRAIAERHNGQVMLRSRAGKGTVFALKLPVGERAG